MEENNFTIDDVYDAIDNQKEGFEIYQEIAEGVKAAIVVVGINSQRDWRRDPVVPILREAQEYQREQISRAVNDEGTEYEKKVYVALIVISGRIRKFIDKLKNEGS